MPALWSALLLTAPEDPWGALGPAFATVPAPVPPPHWTPQENPCAWRVEVARAPESSVRGCAPSPRVSLSLPSGQGLRQQVGAAPWPPTPLGGSLSSSPENLAALGAGCPPADPLDGVWSCLEPTGSKRCSLEQKSSPGPQTKVLTGQGVTQASVGPRPRSGSCRTAHTAPPQPGGRPHPHTRRVRAPSTVNTCTLNPGLLRLSQEGAGEEQGGK